MNQKYWNFILSLFFGFFCAISTKSFLFGLIAFMSSMALLVSVDNSK